MRTQDEESTSSILKEQQSSEQPMPSGRHQGTIIKHQEFLTYQMAFLPPPLLYSPTHVGRIPIFTPQHPYHPIYTGSSELL